MENSDKNNVRPQNKNLRPPMKKGETLNPNGRPKGQRNYATIYREALFKLAALNDITPEAIEDDMIKMAVTKARKGDPIFYKDVMDRIHGKPLQGIDHTSKGEKLPTPIISLNDLRRNDSNSEDTVTEA